MLHTRHIIFIIRYKLPEPYFCLWTGTSKWFSGKVWFYSTSNPISSLEFYLYLLRKTRKWKFCCWWVFYTLFYRHILTDNAQLASWLVIYSSAKEVLLCFRAWTSLFYKLWKMKDCDIYSNTFCLCLPLLFGPMARTSESHQLQTIKHWPSSFWDGGLGIRLLLTSSTILQST